MKIKSALGGLAVPVLLVAGWTVLNSTGDSFMYRQQAPRAAPATGPTYGHLPSPTTREGRWVYLTGSWTAKGEADFLYSATSSAPGGGPHSGGQVRMSIQVRTGDTIRLTVRAHAGTGRAACWIQRAGESYQDVKRPARADSGNTDSGTVTCTRVVDW